MQLVEIMKPFAGDRLYEAGEVVDADGWRNLNTLLLTGKVRRYIPPESIGAGAKSAEQKRSRR